MAGVGFIIFNVCGIMATVLLVGASGEDKFMKRARAFGKVLAVMAIIGLVVYILKY